MADIRDFRRSPNVEDRRDAEPIDIHQWPREELALPNVFEDGDGTMVALNADTDFVPQPKIPGALSVDAGVSDLDEQIARAGGAASRPVSARPQGLLSGALDQPSAPLTASQSLGVFNPAASDQNVAANAAADLPADFSEAFDVAWRSGTEFNNSAAYTIARERALTDYNDEIYQKTGERLPWLGYGPEDASIGQFNDAQTKLQQKVPGLDYLTPLSEGDINAMTLRRMAKAHADAAAFSNRETSWSGTAGTIVGTLAGGLADPVMAATAPLGGAGELGIGLRALEFAGISGGSTAVSAGLGVSSREAAVPGSSKEIPGEILGATLTGGVLGGAFGLLGKVLSLGAKTLPTTVRDEVNAAASEYQFHATNPFPTAAGETAARDATVDAVKSVVNGDAVTAGTGFDIQHVDDYAASLSSSPSFTTAKGSTYEVHEDGTTTRNKMARSDPGHEGDSGIKTRTAKTIYVAPEVASELSGAGLQDLGPTGFRVAIKDGKAYGLTWNKAADQWGASPGGRDIPFTTEPEVGRAPVELWKPATDVPGYEAYRGQHAGNVITEVRGKKPADYALAAEAKTPEELALAGEQHLRPETFAEKPDVQAFDRMPSETDDAASYWDKRLEGASPEEKAALGATDGERETVAGAAIRSEQGQVFTGTTHADAGIALFDAGHSLSPKEAGDGFVTSTGRFIDRDEAMAIAKKNDQLKNPDMMGPDSLLHARDVNLEAAPDKVDVIASDVPQAKVDALAVDPQTDDAVLRNALGATDDIGAGTGRSASGLTLEHAEDIPFPDGSSARRFNINDADGNKLGVVDIEEKDNGRTLEIVHIGTEQGSSNRLNLGPRGVREVLKEVREQYPQAETLTGHRISGAHKGETKDVEFALPPRDRVTANDVPQEKVDALAGDPKTDDAVLRNLDRIRVENPDAQFTTQVRQPDGSFQLVSRPLEDVMDELDSMETLGKELEACAVGMEAAE